MTRGQIRQGDVLLVPVDQPEGELVRATDEAGRPLAGLEVAGERTGHVHRLASRVYDTAIGRLLFVERPTPLTHEEHRHVEVPAGWWRPVFQREYVPASRPARRSRVD